MLESRQTLFISYNAPSLANPARRHETGFDGIFPRSPVRPGSA